MNYKKIEKYNYWDYSPQQTGIIRDCSHTIPMHTLAEETPVFLSANNSFDVKFDLLESFVE